MVLGGSPARKKKLLCSICRRGTSWNAPPKKSKPLLSKAVLTPAGGHQGPLPLDTLSLPVGGGGLLGPGCWPISQSKIQGPGVSDLVSVEHDFPNLRLVVPDESNELVRVYKPGLPSGKE